MTDLTIDEGQADSSFGEVTQRTPSEETPAEEPVTTEAPTEETTEETEETTEEETPKEETKETPEESKLTEKGTKLDPDPLRAANQQRANAEAKARALESLLSDPQRLSEYMKEQFPVKEEPQPLKKYAPEDFENLEDVAAAVNKIQEESIQKTQTLESQVSQLLKTVDNLTQGGKAQQIASTMETEVVSLQKEPELDPKNPDYIEGLEERIANRYHKLDFDEQTQSYRGQYSIADIGKDLIDAARLGKSRGSQKAQTVVKDKTAGKVVTSPKVTETVDTDNLNPADSIAQGISKTFR